MKANPKQIPLFHLTWYQTSLPMLIAAIVVGRPRDVKDVFVDRKVYLVEVEQDLRITSMTFVTETPQATQSDIATPVKLFRRDNTHDSVIVHYATKSDTAGVIEK